MDLMARRRVMLAQKKQKTYEWHAGQPLPNWIVLHKDVGTTITVDDGGITIDSNNAGIWRISGVVLSEPLKAELLSLSQYSITFEYTNAYCPESNASINFSALRNSYIYSQTGLAVTKIKASGLSDISNIWGEFAATDGNVTIISNSDGVNEFYKDGVLKYTATIGGLNTRYLCWVQQGSTANSRAYMTITKITIKA